MTPINKQIPSQQWRNHDCSGYYRCLSRAAIADDPALSCDSCLLKADTGAALRSGDPQVRAEIEGTVRLLIAIGIE
jgi:hypothetical protein